MAFSNFLKEALDPSVLLAGVSEKAKLEFMVTLFYKSYTSILKIKFEFFRVIL